MNHGKNIDEVLKRGLRSASKDPKTQLDAARDRVLQRVLETKDCAEVAVPSSRRAMFQTRLAMVSAAALLLLAFIVVTAWQQPSAPAVVENTAGPSRNLQFGDIVHANDGGRVVVLADGSRIEMKSRSELLLERADDGVRIRLNEGVIIVTAAKQRVGHLYVQTKDVTVSVVGTVFLVNVEEEGSSVSVIEGEVRVQQGSRETKLRPGEHVSTVPKPEPRAVKEEIAWSPKSEEHIALLQQSAGQTPQAPQSPKLQFEEAAIRPCTPEQQRGPDPVPGARGGGGNVRFIQITPGRFYAQCMTVAWLIPISHRKLLRPETETEKAQAAARGLSSVPDTGLAMGKTYYYGSEGDAMIAEKINLRGGQQWILNDGYTIEAITDGSTDALTIQRAMLWDLLERRFQVKVHTEVEQIPVFALTIAPGGLKMKPFQEGECTTEKTQFPNPKPKCNQVNGGYIGPKMRLEAGNHTLSALAFLLKGPLGASIIDKTGNTDRFSMVLEFGLDETLPNAVRQCQQMAKDPDEIAECAGRPTAPSIHTALGQLGLKLEPISAPREFIVVDRAERPTPN